MKEKLLMLPRQMLPESTSVDVKVNNMEGLNHACLIADNEIRKGRVDST